MTPESVLLWAVRALSFFNTIALLWLGLAVLLNVERRRTPGTWLAGGGLLLGGFFFAGHTAIVGGEPSLLDGAMDLWWWGCWFTATVAPYLWYVVVAWYTGNHTTPGGRRTMLLLGVLAMLLLLGARGLVPPYALLRPGGPFTVPSFAGVPIAALVYPGFSVLCVIAGLACLRSNGGSDRFMGDLARERAGPWLAGASIMLLVVVFSAAAAAAWFITRIATGDLSLDSPETLGGLLRFDLVISAQIAAASVLMGRAVVSYEVFTGKTLPRRGLFRHWRSSLFLGAGYGVLMATSLSLPIGPSYHLLLATVLLAGFLALWGWRDYGERQQGMARLRTFLASQGLYECLLGHQPPSEADSVSMLRALCDDILGASVAYLVPMGALASLAGPPLRCPPEPGSHPVPARFPLSPGAFTPQTVCLPADPAAHGGARWAVSLWNDGGLAGVLLLGDKKDGGLYTQEEMEVARSAGERIIDSRAGAELARRLMNLQRQRLGESQVLDQRTRRVLHDDALPRLHEAILGLKDKGPVGADHQNALAQLTQVHRQLSDLLRALPAPLAPEVARLGVLGALHRVVEEELGESFGSVVWEVEPVAQQAIDALSPVTAEVLFCAAREAARNAARHARPPDDAEAPDLAVVATCRNGLELAIADNGRGFTPQPQGGAGQGLALHGTLLAVVGGSLSLDAPPGGSTRVVLSLPSPAAQS